ncbi:putative Rhomboid-related protein 3 [Hypsibius exemplaris]|uniref:Rhomboid-related protein 3 n=1 Tax=Hypsibius exemplaris TaxID=2072580 RepID=A0A9X6N9L4_HYPEX|nr:putative Rhomboid-related protein 3 [Hypsibius exemplaris]
MTHVYPYLGPHYPHPGDVTEAALTAKQAAEADHLQNGAHRKDFRKEFERRWKGIFRSLDKEKTGKVPMTYLKQRLQDSDQPIKIPSAIRESLLANSALHKEDHLDFHKFLRLIENVAPGAHLTRFQQVVADLAYNVLPLTDRPEFVESEIRQFNCRPPPVFLLIITLVEIAVYVYYSVTAPVGQGAILDVDLSGPLIYNPFRRKEVWRLLSYMLVHSGYWHLIMNMVSQVGIGIPLELVHKFWRIGPVYLLGVVAGALGTSVTDPNVFLAGASGGVYALIAAYLAHVVINWKEIEYNWVRLVGWLVVVGVDIGVALYTRYGYHGPNWNVTPIGYSAHFSGALCGFLLGVVILRCFEWSSWERILWWICLVLTISLFTFAVFWNIFWPKFPPQAV